MGWLYMTSLNGFAGPRQYLDAELTDETPEHRSKVLRSALVGMRVYYAAVERIHTAGAMREVWAAVCLVRYNPRHREGHIFGYKDMSESMGPCERDCPEAILDLLTPTENDYARQWRVNCRTRAADRRVQSKKPMPRPGQIIVFDQPIDFTDGNTLDRFEVVANPSSHRTVLFRAPDFSSLLYQIQNVKKRSYQLIDLPQ